MKISKYLIILSIIGTLLGSSCSKGKSQTQIERENWITELNDSVAYYQREVSRLDSQLNILNISIDSQIGDFELIDNPREVEGYYLLKGWKEKLPLTSTGIYARINVKEKLELIATLGGSKFNQIAVKNGTEEFYSEIVPHDQAFNFRHERFNTVYFTGNKADTIAEFIANNVADKIHLLFLEGKTTGDFVMKDNEKEMIMKTWDLYHSQSEAKKLQRDLWISSKKVETLRRLIFEENNPKE